MSPAPLPISKLPKLADVPHALPYQGSKRALAHFILRLIPKGCPKIVEPFAGSAAISVGARHIGAVQTASISDVNQPLMNLWSRIIYDPEGLCDDYDRLWNEQLSDPRSYYDEVRGKFNATGEPHYLLYLLARCVKAAIRYSKTGAFNQSADQRRLGAKPQAMRARIEGTSRVMQRSTVWSGSYEKTLLGASADDVVYLDPPYQGVSHLRDHRYMRGLDRSEFEKSLASAVDAGVSFILSYDGATSGKTYGDPLSGVLNLIHFSVVAGVSTQATLRGLKETTIESVYLSPALAERLGGEEWLRASLVAGAHVG